MAFQSLGVGTNANDGSGDTLKAGGAKMITSPRFIPSSVMQVPCPVA